MISLSERGRRCKVCANTKFDPVLDRCVVCVEVERVKKQWSQRRKPIPGGPWEGGSYETHLDRQSEREIEKLQAETARYFYSD